MPDISGTGGSAYGAPFAELRSALDEGAGVVSRLWSFRTEKKVRSLATDQGGPRVESRILVGSEDGAAYLLAADGALVWRFQTDTWVQGAGFVRFEQTAETFAVVGSDKLYLLDGAGSVVYQVETPSRVTSLGIGQLQGRMAVVTGHDDGTLQGYDPRRGVFWRAATPKRVVSVECCDLNFDGRMEIAAASEDKFVYVFDDIGALEDRLQSNHWIISLAVGDVYGDGTRRLVIAGFDGSVFVYGGGKSAALRMSRQGILGVSMGRLIPGSPSEHFVIGSSDQRVSIFEQSGRELWRFSTSYGNRVVRVLESETEASLVVGAEDGMVHCVALRLVDGLLERISSAFKQVVASGSSLPSVDRLGMATLSDIVDFEEKPEVFSRSRVLEYADERLPNSAAFELVGLWIRGVEESWRYQTDGRVYDLAVSPADSTSQDLLLAASGDGTAYALAIGNGEVVWTFRADGPVRGVRWIPDEPGFGPGALIGSVDGCVYRLDAAGRPLWHRQSGDWVLHTGVMPRLDSVDGSRGWFGSEGRYIEAFDRFGRGLWQFPVGDRVRALNAGDVDGDGRIELIAGSDDRHIYVIDGETGALKSSFRVPHWVLAVAVADLSYAGQPSILVGTEDGRVYVYDWNGALQWSFKTGHWVAAVDVRATTSEHETQVLVGSADCSVYGLSARGGLQWRWRTEARVRTIADCREDPLGNGLVAYGSYDKAVQVLRLVESRAFLALVDRATAGLDGLSATSLSSELRALLALRDNDHQAAIDILRSNAGTAAKALCSALLLADSKSLAMCPELAGFLARRGEDDGFLAVIRSLSQFGADRQMVKATAEEIRKLDRSEAGRVRADALLQVLS